MPPKPRKLDLSDPLAPLDNGPVGRWRVRFEKDFATDNTALYLWKHPFSRYGDQSRHFVTGLTFTEVKMDQAWHATDNVTPTFVATRDAESDGIGVTQLLQEMLDAAWAAGLRPSDFNEKDHESELKAVRFHLEDMRKLALK